MPKRKSEEELFKEISAIIAESEPLLKGIEEFRELHLKLFEEQLSQEEFTERQRNRQECRRLDDPDPWYPVEWPAWSASLRTLKKRITELMNGGQLRGRSYRRSYISGGKENDLQDEQMLQLMKMDLMLHEITQALHDYPLQIKTTLQPIAPNASLLA